MARYSRGYYDTDAFPVPDGASSGLSIKEFMLALAMASLSAKGGDPSTNARKAVRAVEALIDVLVEESTDV